VDVLLQLRVEKGSVAQLIHYHRTDSAGPKLSHYTIATTETPEELKTILSQAMGELGRVRKRRLLFLVGQTRVHIDTVERLGDFLELEVSRSVMR
jgi:adenylate cyclase class IV